MTMPRGLPFGEPDNADTIAHGGRWLGARGRDWQCQDGSVLVGNSGDKAFPGMRTDERIRWDGAGNGCGKVANDATKGDALNEKSRCSRSDERSEIDVAANDPVLEMTIGVWKVDRSWHILPTVGSGTQKT